MKGILIEVLLLFLRVIPFPTKPRLIKIGNPDKNSPVLVTTNYLLTVKRLINSIKNIDCYVLVAQAKGINVWCSSVENYFSVDSMISIIKTSGIENLVNHRTLILPQLSASAISLKELKNRTGWNGRFGPIKAKDIPEFVSNGFQITPSMTKLRYGLFERFEMSVAMASSILIRFSIYPLILTGFVGVKWFILGVITNSSLMHYYFDSLEKKFSIDAKKIINLLSFVLFNMFYIAVHEISIFSYLMFVINILAASYLVNNAYASYTPYKQCSYSKEFYGFLPLNLNVDKNECIGCGICAQVCPFDCFDKIVENGKIYFDINNESCVECYSCVTQCPVDAIKNLAEFSTKVKCINRNFVMS